MPWKSSNPNRTGWLQDANTMLVSTLCHLTLLIVLALLSTVGSSGAKDRELVVHLGNGQSSDASTDELALDDALADGQPLGGGGAPLQETVKTVAAFEPIESANSQPLLVESDTGTIHAPAQLEVDKTRLLSNLYGPSPGDGKRGSGSGGPARGGKGRGEGRSAKASTEFFGISGYGQTFVYVVDCSGSMNQNGKFEARYELLHSIEQLNKDQRYFVIFYNHETHPMDGEKPVFATAEKITQTTQWINYSEAGGGTHPLPALMAALSMQPDAIYFLSDGQFDPDTIRLLKYRNRANARLKTKMVPIHSVAFYDRFAAGLMQAIANNSAGEFRFVGH